MQSIKLITKRASEKVLRYAFQYARDIGRKRVTVVHKATIMYDPPVVELISRKMADGLFLSTARDIAKDYPDISFDAELLDNTCLRVPPNPEKD